MDALSALTPDVVSLLERHQLLLPLIRAELTHAELATVEPDPDQIQQLWQQFRAQRGLATEEDFAAWLESSDVSRDQIAEQLSRPLRLAAYCTEQFGHRAEVRFLERKNALDQVVYSLIRLQDPFQAREFYLQISEGEADFGAIASQFSGGAEAKTRGVVGPVPLQQAHPKLVELLRSSQPGQLLEPIVIENWHLIVRLESYQPAVLDAAMEQRMAQELFAEWVEAEAQRRLRLLTAPGSADSEPGES